MSERSRRESAPANVTNLGPSDEFYAMLVAEHTKDVVVVTCHGGRVLWANSVFRSMTGYEMPEIIGRKPGDFLQGPETDPDTIALISERIKEQRPVEVEILNYTKSRQPYWIELSITPVFENGTLKYFVAVERDITERRRERMIVDAARKREAKTRRERRLLREISEWLYASQTLEELCRIVELGMASLLPFGPGCLYIFRNSKNQLESAAMWGGAKPSYDMHPSACWAMRRGRPHIYGLHSINLRCDHESGDTPHASCCLPLLANGDTLGMLHIHFNDISPALPGRDVAPEVAAELEERRQLAVMCSEQIGLAIANVRLRNELQTQSTRDVLTGLCNRRWFLEAAHTALQECIYKKEPLTLISLDADHFKKVNDSFGHATGDMTLRMLAGVMSETVGEHGTACRIGGEEFTIMLPRMGTDEANEMAEKILERVRQRTRSSKDNHLPPITVSAGISTAPDHATELQHLIEAADRALYKAKRTGRDKVVISDGTIADD
ncbi:MAG: diguanylate cyclase [Pseudomonadota bacterium]